MKELFLFIRNNRIIYKVSIVSILVLMLISVVQINPENIKKNNVGAENGIDYTIEFRASDGKFYNMDTDTEINVISMGLMAMVIPGEEEKPQVAALVMNNCNITSKADIALYINGDAYLYVSPGTENNIISSYSGDNSNCYGIKSKGNIVIGSDPKSGAGTLNVDYDNTINNDKVYTAIYSNRSISIDTSNIIAKGNQYGIYSGENITVYSGNIEVSALGNNGVGISAKNNLTVQGGNIISKGMGRAVQYSSLSTTENTELNTHTGVIIASTDIDCKSVEKYSNDNISSYKYMELGIICDYYLKYTPKTGELKKVLSNGTEENINFEDVPGLKKSNTTDKYGGYTLILDGFNFVTSCQYGLYIDDAKQNGNDVSIKVKAPKSYTPNHKVMIAVYGTDNGYMTSVKKLYLLDTISIPAGGTAEIKEKIEAESSDKVGIYLIDKSDDSAAVYSKIIL